MTNIMVKVQTAIADREDRGAAMAEYGLLLAFIALAAIGVLFVFGESLKSTFTLADETLGNSAALNGGGTGTGTGTGTN